MRNDKQPEDFAKRLIYEEMARSSPSQQFNQNLETPGCLTKLSYPDEMMTLSDDSHIPFRTGYEKADLNQLEPECIVSTTTC